MNALRIDQAQSLTNIAKVHRAEIQTRSDMAREIRKEIDIQNLYIKQSFPRSLEEFDTLSKRDLTHAMQVAKYLVEKKETSRKVISSYAKANGRFWASDSMEIMCKVYDEDVSGFP